MLKHGYCLPSQRTVLKLGCYVDLDICCISRWRKDSDHFLNSRTSRLNLYSADCLFSSVRCRSLNNYCESKILVWHCALFWVCLSRPVLYLNNKAYVIERVKKHYHELVRNANSYLLLIRFTWLSTASDFVSLMIHKRRIHLVSLDTGMVSVNRTIPINLRIRWLVHWFRCYWRVPWGN